MKKNQKNHQKNTMKKSEFLEIITQVKERQFSDLGEVEKRELGLTDKNKTIPFEEINTDAQDCYYMDSKGFRPGSADLKDFNKYPYKTESERIKVVRGLNKEIQILNEKYEKERKKLFQLEKDKESSQKEIERLREFHRIPRFVPPFPEYPVLFILKWVSKNIKQIKFKLDSKIIYNLCLQDKEKTITERWNRTVLEFYESKKAKKYKTYLEPFYEWFEDKERDIDSPEYKAIPLLYAEHPENEAGEDSEKYYGEWQGSKIELAKEMRSEKEDGVFETYIEAYRHAEKHITVKGKPVISKNLESLYHKTQSTNINNI